MKHYARTRALCDWADFDQWQASAVAALADPDAAALSPFHLLSLPGITGAQQRECADQWMLARLAASAADRALLHDEFDAADLLKSHAAATEPPAAGAAPERLRLGYLSCDFHEHATALLAVELFEAHDRTRFELHAYSYGADDGLDMRQRLMGRFDHFTDIRELSDMDAARRIHADGIHILIDLKGYTAATRTSVLTYRPAPVQVNYLGYPGTLGGDFCDYLISDRFITPNGTAGDYSEALACMPHSYQPHGRRATIGAAPTRQEVGLPEQGLVLCCFNQAYKFTPEVFDIWCLLLSIDPDSVLWLLGDSQAEGHLRQEALRRGIAPHRLVFAPPRPQIEHLGRLQLADLVLDTSPYNAHTTASDALWAGVPVLTCAGDTFAARVAGSLLHAAGLPELVTHSLQDYTDLALALVEDPARLAALRQRLAAQRDDCALFDIHRYALDLETLYRAMWDRHTQGLPPHALTTHPSLDAE